MGCISSAPSTNPHEVKKPAAPVEGLARQITITLTSPENDDIVIIRHGNYYIIQGTLVVVDVMSCRIIGYLDDQDVFHKEENEYIKTMCAKYDMNYL